MVSAPKLFINTCEGLTGPRELPGHHPQIRTEDYAVPFNRRFQRLDSAKQWAAAAPFAFTGASLDDRSLNCCKRGLRKCPAQE